MDGQAKIKNEHDETVKAGCIVVNDGQEVLLINDHKKVWTFPKGHAEAGETVEQVAVRETKEETGYTVQLIKRLSDLTYTHPHDGEQIRVAMFLARPIGGPQPVTEQTESKWFGVEEARTILAYSNLTALLDEAISTS